jgi:P-type conjugative transfer protein TrbJ
MNQKNQTTMGLLKQPSLQKKFNKQLTKKKKEVSMKILVLFSILLTIGIPSSHAGQATGDATEITQIANNMQLSAQYAQQTQQYGTQLKQYQTEIQNLQLNPASLMNTDATRIITGVGGVMQSGQAIGGTMSKIDGNFSNTYKSPLAGTYSENFKTWTNATIDTLGGAMRAAGLHRDAYSTDTAALTALFNKTQTSQGNSAALQTLSEITVAQTQQLQKLNDLISSQNLASSSYMASQASQQQAGVDNTEVIKKSFADSQITQVQSLDTSKKTYKKWNFYKPQSN